MHLDAVELLRQPVVGRLEQAAAVTGGLADPAGEKARVPGLERPLELLDAAAVLAQRRAQRPAVVEEDVDPDPRVRTGHARHVAERAADRRERVVAVDAVRAGLVQRGGSRARAADGS